MKLDSKNLDLDSVELIDPSTENSRGMASSIEGNTSSIPSAIQLTLFLDEVTKVFSRSSLGKLTTEEPTAEEKAYLSFSRVAMGLYAQFELMKDFDSLQGPLKEQLSNLVQKLSEAEFNLNAADRLIKKKDGVIEKLSASNNEMREVIEKQWSWRM